MDDIDIDDYSRDRSRSPARERSKSPNPSARRDYEAPREDEAEEARPDRRRDGRDDRRGGFSRRERGGRGERRGGRDSRDDGERVDRNYDNSIFVGNVPFQSTSQDIQQLFGSDFRIVRADIVSVRGRSRGMATVEFASKEEVQQAISKFDRSEFQGREIFVRQDYPPPEDKRGERREERRPERERGERGERRERERLDPNEPAKPGCEVFVGNLPFSVTWQNLKDLMRSVGSVVRADIMTTKFRKSRGFGTVVFNSAEEAQAAVDRFQGYVMEGRELDVRLGREPAARKKPSVSNSQFTDGVVGDGPPSSLIYAGNLPFITTETDLYELFETIGRVTKAEIQYNDRGRPNGNAVVEFESVDLAHQAIQNLHGYNYGGRDLRITFGQRHGAGDINMYQEPGFPAEQPGFQAAQPQHEPEVAAVPEVAQVPEVAAVPQFQAEQAEAPAPQEPEASNETMAE